MDQTKSIELQKKRLESAEERRARLDKENERARAKWRTETEEQKKMRKLLQKKELPGWKGKERAHTRRSATSFRTIKIFELYYYLRERTYSCQFQLEGS